MCEPQHFDFIDLNLDFLDITPPAPTQGAPNVTKCFIPSINTKSKPNINKTDESSSSRKNSKVQELAKRIASTDLCMQQIQALQEERSQLQQQLQELQSSADDVRRLYDEESQERKHLKYLSDKLTIKCDALQKEIANKSLSCDQMESELENIKCVPIDYNELVQSFLKLCSSYDEEVKPLQKPQLDLLDKLRKYCKEHSIKTPEMMRRSPKKRIRKPPKPEAGIQCELWKMAPMPNASTTLVPKEMRSQGTQHISTTTTRSTCTSTFIKKHNVGTSFPEASLLPPVNDIVIEMLKWDIRPLSPICDFIPVERTGEEKLKKSTGTCTKLCNIQRSIDYISVGQSLLSSIKRSNSRPPSRNMFDSFKHELPTPPPSSPPITPFVANNFPHLGSMSNALSAATFEDLWQVFGQMLFGLLGNRPDNWSSAARSGNAQSQQDFYHWLRSLYADITEHEQLHQQPQQQQQQPISTTETCIGSSIANEGLNTIPQNTDNSQFIFPGRHEMYLTPTQGYVDTSQHTSIATSPIRPSSPNSGDICKVIIPSQSHSEMQNINISIPLVPTEYQAHNGLNDENKKLPGTNIVNDILKLFPSTESTQETKKKLNKMLNMKRKRKSNRQKLNKNKKADVVKEKINTIDSITPGKEELSTSVEDELREYSEIIPAISPIREHNSKDIDQQNDMSGDSFSFSPTEESKVLGESELRVDIRKLDGLSPIKYDDLENKSDDVKLEDGRNCFIPHNENVVPQGQTNELWVEVEKSEQLEDNIKDISPADENELPQNQRNELWKDNERTSVISCTEDEITDFIEDNLKDGYKENSCISLSENEVSQKNWNYNENTSAILHKKEEKTQQTEDNIKDDYKKTSFFLPTESQVPQNQGNERWYDFGMPTVISSTKMESIEHIGDDVKEDYYAENEEPHNQTNVFNNENSRSSAISCAEKGNVEHLDDIKDDEEASCISLSINQAKKDQGNNLWIENGRTSVPCCDRNEKTEHLEGDKEEIRVETTFSSTRPNGELESNQSEEPKPETESTPLLPSFTENAVDFLSQLQLTSYSLAQNETLTPFVYESPQSPTSSSNTNLEFCESSMDNNEFCSQSGYSSAHSVQDNNSKNSAATTCLMNSLFGSITDSDSDDDIKDELSAEENKIQKQNIEPNQPSHLNSFTFDYKVSNVENLNKLRPEEKLNNQSFIKDVASKRDLMETPLKLTDAHYKHQPVEQQIEKDLPDFKLPKSQQPMTINIAPELQRMSPPHINANDLHKNEQPELKLLQNQINSNVTSTSFLKRQPMNSDNKKYKQIESNNYERPFINKPNSAVLQAHNQELESIPASSVAEEKEAVGENFKYLEGKTYECNLVIDEDCCNTGSEYSQDNASILDSTSSTNDAEEKTPDNSNEQAEARSMKRKSEEVKIEEVSNQNSTQNMIEPPPISVSKLQSSPAKEIRENLVKYEATSMATATTNNCIDDDHFSKYLNNILRQVEPRNVSPISIISNSTAYATPIKNYDDAYQSESRKRGRKRKSSLCPNTAPTAAIACKRSERLRVKESASETKLDTTSAPLNATIKIGKYTTMHGNDCDKYPASFDSNANTIDDEETLSVSPNLDYFTKRSTAMCDLPEEKNAEEKATKTQNMHSLTSPNINLRCNQPTGYQDIFQSFADQHRKCLQKKKPENWAAIPPMQQTSKDEFIKPNVRFNCDIAKDESSIDHAAEQQYESPASPSAPDTTDTLDSPASPFADSFETTSKHCETKEIPLEPDSTRLKVQHSSLLQRLIANHSNSLHQLVMDTFNKKYSNSIQAQLWPQLKKFVVDTDDTNAEAAAIQVVQDLLLITLNIKHITAAIVVVMQDVPRPEVELACALADVPPKYLGKQHRRISFVMRGLQQLQPSFTSELMGHIESTLFNYNTNENLPLAATLNLTQLYLLTVSICMPDMQKNPARLFVAKCLYYYNLKAVPMIYEVLCCFPTSLPHREERRYDRADALINVIQHLLMSTKYDMDKQDLRTKELLSKLRFEYHFEPFQPERSEVLTNLVDKIKSDKLENVSYALALFCKRLPQPKVEADVLESQLMPLANEFYQIVTHSTSYDSRIACLLECISMVIKPFRMDTNIAIYMSIFSRFLNVVTRATPQEAAVRAIIRCQRFGYVNCYNELLNFKPCYELQPITKAMLETFVYRKTAKFWRSLNTSAVNLTF